MFSQFLKNNFHFKITAVAQWLACVDKQNHGMLICFDTLKVKTTVVCMHVFGFD